MLPFNSSDSHDSPSAARLLNRCDFLAKISALPEGIYRNYLSKEHKQCNQKVHEWMTSAGMHTWQDAVGNCWGRYVSDVKDAPILILGSHLDTVKNAGAYDGILGVLSAIELIEKFAAHNVKLPFTIDVVGFADEEGARFGATLLGSRAAAGTWKNEWLELTDAQGVSMHQAFQTFGLDPSKIHSAQRNSENLLGYFELHIEQGPILEEKNVPVGVVNAIAGARRFNLILQGVAGHAGTVPMDMRRDPLVVAAKAIGAINKIAIEHGVLATVGKIEAGPGAVNVIPGKCQFSLDIRSGDDSLLERAIDGIFEEINKLCFQEEIKFLSEEIHSASAVACAGEIQALCANAIQEIGIEPISLLSGAGHDAMAFAGVTNLGMMFVRCRGGISHHPDESVELEDVNSALNAMFHVVTRFHSIRSENI